MEKEKLALKGDTITITLKIEVNVTIRLNIKEVEKYELQKQPFEYKIFRKK